MSGSQPPNGRVFASTPMCPLTAFSSSLGGIRSPQLLLGLLLGIACVTRVAEASREEEHNHGDLQTVELRVASMLHAEPVAKINLLEIAENSTVSLASARTKDDCDPSDCTGDCDETGCPATNCQWDAGGATCAKVGVQNLNMYEAARQALGTGDHSDQEIVDREHTMRKDADWAKIKNKLEKDNAAKSEPLAEDALADLVAHEKIKHDLMYSGPSRNQWANNLDGNYIHVNQQYNLLTKTANDLVDHIDNGDINVAKTVAAAVAAKTHAEKLEGEMAQYGEDLRYLQKGGTHFAANVKEYHKNVQEQLKHKVAGADLKNLNGELEEWYASGHSRTSPVDPFALDERTSPSKKIIAAYVPPAYDPRHMAHDESGDTSLPALMPSGPTGTQLGLTGFFKQNHFSKPESAIKDELGLTEVKDLPYVKASDLAEIGMSDEEQQRFLAAVELWMPKTSLASKVVPERTVTDSVPTVTDSGAIAFREYMAEKRRKQAATISRQSSSPGLTGFFKRNHFSKFESALKDELGLTEVKYLAYVKASDLAEIGMSAEEQQRFLAAVELVMPKTSLASEVPKCGGSVVGPCLCGAGEVPPKCRDTSECEEAEGVGTCKAAEAHSESLETDEHSVQHSFDAIDKILKIGGDKVPAHLSYTFPEQNYSARAQGLAEETDAVSEGGTETSVLSDCDQIRDIIEEAAAKMPDKAAADKQLKSALGHYVLKMRNAGDKAKITLVLKAGGVEIL